MKSYFSLFRNYANFSGYMKRGEYWAAMIIHWFILTVPLLPGMFFLLGQNHILPSELDLSDPDNLITKVYLPWVLPLWCLYFVLMFIPVWSASVRRLHTLPRRGIWLLIGLIPVMGWFIVLIWLLQKGTYEEYRWRLKKAGPKIDQLGTGNNALKEMERARNGKWFFVVLFVLVAGGWFLNRQILMIGGREKVMAVLSRIIEENSSGFNLFP